MNITSLKYPEKVYVMMTYKTNSYNELWNVFNLLNPLCNLKI